MVLKMNHIDIKSLLRQNEGETLEFKRFEKLENMNDKKKKDLVKLFVALANNKGGQILFGVTDDRKLDDYELTEDKYKSFSQKLIQIADSNCNPPIYFSNIQQIKIDDHIILLVDVPSGKDIPHTFEGNFYIRIQDQNIKITDPNKIKELIEQKKKKKQEIVIEKEEEHPGETFYTIVRKYLDSIVNDDDEFGTSNVYTKLSAIKKLPSALKFGEQENNREEEFEVLDLVKKEKNLIISGASGSGKTITLKWLNINFSEEYLNGGDCNIPLYIELNTYNKGNFYEYIKIKADEKGLSKSILDRLLSGKLIFLIDGFDLISPTDGFTPYEEISNFISKYNKCKYVISSRPDFFKVIQNEFKILELKELNETNIKTFVSKYIIDNELANNITDQILNDDKLISLFKNPMMLRLYIIVQKSRFQDGIEINNDLLSKRSDFYGFYISELFDRHIRKGKSLNANETQILDTLKNLYFKLQCQNDVDCKYDYAVTIALKYSGTEKILDDLFNIGILLKYKYINDPYDYVKYGIHQSFQEYFAALKLKECFENNCDLSPVFKHPKWEDVVIFATEMFKCPGNFIDKMIDSRELDLASKCAQNARKYMKEKDIKEKLCKCLAEKLDERYTSERTDAIESLSRLGDIGIDLILEAAADEDDNIHLYADYVLRKIKSDETVKPLIEALNDESELVQLNAIAAIGNIKSYKDVKPLIKILADESNDVDVQRSAADALGKIKSYEAVKPLIKVLDDESDGVDVRRSAADALGKIKSYEAVKPLIKVLDDESDDVDVRRSAANALGEIESYEAVEPLIKVLADESDDVDVRRSAANALGEIESYEAVEPLINTLNDEKDAMRRSVANALQQLLEIDSGMKYENHSMQIGTADNSIKNRSDKMIKLLIEALNDVNNGVLISVANALQQLLEHDSGIKYENHSVRIGTADNSVKNRLHEAINLFMEALNNENDSTRKSAVNALEKIESEKAVNLFIRALDDENGMRRSVVDALGKIKSDKAVEPLIRVLNDENDDMRRSVVDALQQLLGHDPEKKKENVYMQKSAAFALGEIQSDKAIKSLIGVLNNESDFVRRSAVDALGKIQSNEAVEPLIKMLADENEDVRRSVVDALGEIKSDEAVKPLVEVLTDENEDGNVQSIVDALGKIKSDKAVKLFIAMLDHENNDVRKNAIYILGEIKSYETVKPLIEMLTDESDDADVRRSVVYALGEIKSYEAVKPIIDVLTNKCDDVDVRRSVVYALGKIKSYEAVKPLIDVLTDESDDVDVRRSVVYALGEIKSYKAVKPLIDVLTDESDDVDVRRSVVYALGEIRHYEAVKPLIEVLTDKRDDVRRDAADALGKIHSNEAVKPLINALNTENEFLLRSVVNALNNVITTENKNLLESLLKSKNENIANISHDLLKKIDKIEKSEGKILLNKTQNSKKEDSNNLDNQKLCGEPAEKGRKDPYIDKFVDKLKPIKEPTSIVDYGCGQGKLLCALTTLPDVAANNISYFGVDEKTLCRYISRLTAKNCGLFELFTNYPEFLKPKKFYAKDVRLDYAFLMHALHEIKLIDLIEIVYSISTKLKIDGMIFILDQRKLVEQERNFVLWDDKKDFETLFSNSGFEMFQRFIETSSGNKLSSIEAKKIQENCFPKEKVTENCLKVYESKKVIVSKMRNETVDTEEHKNLSVRYANISDQIEDLKREFLL
jgi:HEAT repeat protein